MSSLCHRPTSWSYWWCYQSLTQAIGLWRNTLVFPIYRTHITAAPATPPLTCATISPLLPCWFCFRRWPYHCRGHERIHSEECKNGGNYLRWMWISQTIHSCQSSLHRSHLSTSLTHYSTSLISVGFRLVRCWFLRYLTHSIPTIAIVQARGDVWTMNTLIAVRIDFMNLRIAIRGAIGTPWTITRCWAVGKWHHPHSWLVNLGRRSSWGEKDSTNCCRQGWAGWAIRFSGSPRSCTFAPLRCWGSYSAGCPTWMYRIPTELADLNPFQWFNRKLGSTLHSESAATAQRPTSCIPV